MKESKAGKIIAANGTLIVDGDLNAVENFFTSDYIAHITNRDLKGGHSLIKNSIGKMRQSFPDIQVDVEIFLENESRISWQRTMQGTLEHAYQGFPASGAKIVWRDMVTSQFRDGLIAEEWVLTDLAERLLLSRKTKK